MARFSYADFPNRDLVWSTAIAFPFDIAISKNRMWRTNRQGRTYVPRDSKEAHEAIVCAIRARQCPVIPKTKLWLSLLVEKPDMRSDALNFLDVVADAASAGLGLNDRWYSVDRIDWQVEKDSPRILLQVGQ